MTRRTRIEIITLARKAAAHGEHLLARSLFMMVGISYVEARPWS